MKNEQPDQKTLIADEKENVWRDDSGDIWEPIRARKRESVTPEKVHDAIRLGLDFCPNCSSGDVRWCGISVRPYCNECGHWGQSHHGTAEEAIKRWNSK